MFTPEEFLDTNRGRRYIHISSEKELMEILDFYRQNHHIMHATVHKGNWEKHPFIFYNAQAIHGSSEGSYRKTGCIEYEEWASMAIPQDFKESDKPLSFLFD